MPGVVQIPENGTSLLLYFIFLLSKNVLVFIGYS